MGRIPASRRAAICDLIKAKSFLLGFTRLDLKEKFLAIGAAEKRGMFQRG